MSVIARKPGRAGGPKRPRVAIGPLQRRHLRDVVKVEHGTYPKPWSREVFESELAQVRDGTRYYVVATDGRSIVGYAGLWFVDGPDGNEAHVTNVVVAGEQRRMGVATRLMLDLADAAIAHDCVSWTLEVRSTNEGALSLYRRFGFAPAGIRKRYYENADDAIVMWCHDIDTDEYERQLGSLKEML